MQYFVSKMNSNYIFAIIKDQTYFYDSLICVFLF